MYELVREVINGSPQEWSFWVLVDGQRVGKFTGGMLLPGRCLEGISTQLMAFLVSMYEDQDSIYWQPAGE